MRLIKIEEDHWIDPRSICSIVRHPRHEGSCLIFLRGQCEPLTLKGSATEVLKRIVNICSELASERALAAASVQMDGEPEDTRMYRDLLT